MVSTHNADGTAVELIPVPRNLARMRSTTHGSVSAALIPECREQRRLDSARVREGGEPAQS
jgi:hypothetical protein